MNGSGQRSRQNWGRGLTATMGLVLCLGPLLAGCHSVTPLTPQEEAGKHLYQVRCAHCHEDNDLALKKVPPDLHGLFDRKTLPSGIPATDEAVRQNVLT